jgi:hypothetical protein
MFPRVEKPQKSSVETAWEGVGKAFEAVGCDMWKAIEDVERLYNIPKQSASSR